MAQHTQGEWGIATIDGGAGDDEVVTVVNGCMVNIAAVFGAGEYSEARPDGKGEPRYEVSEDEAAANARLISAAPDLLTALQCMLNEAVTAGIAMDAWAVTNAQQAVAKALI